MQALKEPIFQPSITRTLYTTDFVELDSLGEPMDIDDVEPPINIVGPRPFPMPPTSKSKLTQNCLTPRDAKPTASVNPQEPIATTSSNIPPPTEQQEKLKKKPDIKTYKPPDLPIYSYKDYPPVPTMVYTCHDDEANDLVQTLRGPIGFDMEWRVLYYPKAPECPTALIQVCDKNVILLIHISSMAKFPEKLKELIESKDIPKMGVNILNDGNKLFRDFGVLSNNLVELTDLARQADPDFNETFGADRCLVSLAHVVARYCGKTLPKGKERTSNWEAKLGPTMLSYAANDAHCALTAYQNLLKMAADHKRTLTPAKYTTAVSFRVLEYKAPNSSGGPPVGPPIGVPPKPVYTRSQHLRAYSLWYRDKLPLDRICVKLRSEQDPLKVGTVISYVLGALESNTSLPFEMTKLLELVQKDKWSWNRHRGFITKMESEGRGKATSSTNLRAI